MVPFAIEVSTALMLMDCSVACVTVSGIVFDVTPFSVAPMSLEPSEVPVARPLALMVATAGFCEFQVTELVRSWLVPSLKVPVAVN